jgi:outer membrane protein assembly factor BamB
MRNVILLNCLCIFASAACLAPAPAQSPNPINQRTRGFDWPSFLGPQGDSTSLEVGVSTPWRKGALPLVWQTTVGEGYCVPSISNGRLFIFDRVKKTARLRCLNAETGAFIWKYEFPSDYRDKYNYNGGPRCCPIVDGERVYVLSADGMLVCLGTASGKLIWKLDTAKEFGVVQNHFGVGSTPIVEGDLLIAQIGGSPPGSDKLEFGDLKGNGSGIVAFDKYTGKVVYRITDELASYASPVVATIAGRRWCFVFARGGLVGFEPRKGTVDFHFPWRAADVESVNASNPVVAGDRVFISECYGVGSALLKIKPGGYEVLWTDAKKKLREKSMMCHWMTPIQQGGYLYGSSGRHPQNAELRCIELATGKVSWTTPGLSRISLLLIDGHFIAQTEIGPLLLIKANPKEYEEISVLEVRAQANQDPLLEYPCWAAPVVARGLLYLRGPDRLVCLELIPEKK